MKEGVLMRFRAKKSCTALPNTTIKAYVWWLIRISLN